MTQDSIAVIALVTGFIHEHPHAEAYFYFESLLREGYDEVIVKIGDVMKPVGENFIWLERPGEIPALYNTRSLYTVEFATGDEEASPQQATSPAPALPGAPAQVE
jgi:hypothetical protein